MVWLILALIIIAIFGWYCFIAPMSKVPNRPRGFKGGTIGDTVAEQFTPEQPGEHWEIAIGPDGKEHFINLDEKESLR